MPSFVYYDQEQEIKEFALENIKNFDYWNKLRQIITEQAGSQVADYIFDQQAILLGGNLFIATSTRFNLQNQPEKTYQNLINIKRVNDVRYLNKFFEAVNSLLPIEGIYINSVETYTIRKERILTRFPLVLNWIIYFFDVLFRRVFPKLPFIKKIYFWMTQGNNRVLSKAETFGRLYSCGFEVISEKQIGKDLYFIARKTRTPYFDFNPTYGPLVRLERLGKDGKPIKVYKARTMHPYAEYLQEYIYTHNSLDDGGKFKNDFRVTTLGKFMRKVWLDELPMLINVMKGQLKIVGVRPLSKHYLSLYPEDVQKRRLNYKRADTAILCGFTENIRRNSRIRDTIFRCMG